MEIPTYQEFRNSLPDSVFMIYSDSEILEMYEKQFLEDLLKL